MPHRLVIVSFTISGEAVGGFTSRSSFRQLPTAAARHARGGEPLADDDALAAWIGHRRRGKPAAAMSAPWAGRCIWMFAASSTAWIAVCFWPCWRAACAVPCSIGFPARRPCPVAAYRAGWRMNQRRRPRAWIKHRFDAIRHTSARAWGHGHQPAIGNLTSQFFDNVVLNELDHFVSAGSRFEALRALRGRFRVVARKPRTTGRWHDAIAIFLREQLRWNCVMQGACAAGQ